MRVSHTKPDAPDASEGECFSTLDMPKKSRERLRSLARQVLVPDCGIIGVVVRAGYCLRFGTAPSNHC